jgi:hypothetical protein
MEALLPAYQYFYRFRSAQECFGFCREAEITAEPVQAAVRTAMVVNAGARRCWASNWRPPLDLALPEAAGFAVVPMTEPRKAPLRLPRFTILKRTDQQPST